MKRYHINPETGNVGPCLAVIKCRFGIDKLNHFSSIKEGQEHYESIQKESSLATLSKASENAKLEKEWLTDEEISKIDVTGVTCPTCGETLTQKQAATILHTLKSTYCLHCDEELDIYSVSIEVGFSKDTFKANNKKNVYKMTWFHSTCSDEWLEDVESGPEFVAHLGSQQAAFDRQIPEMRSDSPQNDFYLYEIKIDRTAKISEKVNDDGNDNFELDKNGETEVHRYVNKWEDMASISLAAPTKKLKIVSKKKISKKEALSTLSLYNIPEQT